MGWQGNAESMMDIKMTGEIQVEFTCPRCNMQQTVQLKIGLEPWTTWYEFECSNPVCGRGNLVGQLDLTVMARYKDTATAPLEGNCD